MNADTPKAEISLDRLYNPVESRIARVLVRGLIHLGCSVSVNDGEETTVSGSKDPNEVLNAMATTDEDRLFVYHDDAEKRQWIYLIYGNGEDLISDYTIGMDNEPCFANIIGAINAEIDDQGSAAYLEDSREVPESAWKLER